MSAAASLPVISLKEFATPQELGKPLYDAATNAGFLYLTDHGVPQETIEKAFELSHNYFLNIPEQSKLEYPFDFKTGLGYSGILDPDAYSKGDFKESFYFSHPSYQMQQYPPELEQQIQTITEYIDAMDKLSLKILAGLACALGLEPNVFTDCHGGRENRCRVLHYPPVSGTVDDTDIRASQHSDYGSITILATETIGGLQVQSRLTGQWEDVQHLPGALVVNIADALEFWSGGSLNSTTHRVVMPRNTEEAVSRFSIAFFVQPDFDVPMKVLTSSGDFSDEDFDRRLAAKGIEPGTRRITSGEFLKARLARTQVTSTDAK